MVRRPGVVQKHGDGEGEKGHVWLDIGTEMVSRVGAWDELLSTCMEGGKPCKEVMKVRTNGGVECRWARGEKRRKDWALRARKEKRKKDLAMSWA